MSIILSAYVPSTFRQYLLPSVNNSDYRIVLKRLVYNLPADLDLQLENIENKWYLRESEAYKIIATKGNDDLSLDDGDIYTIQTKDMINIPIIVCDTPYIFKVARKFNISGLATITIGDDSTNLISYQYSSLVSKHHAEIRKTATGYVITDISSNGTFVNGLRINGSYNLQPGDCINIFGLKIIMIGDVMAISSLGADFTVSPGIPVYADGSASEPQERRHDFLHSVKKFFHRSPRNYMKLDTEDIDIDPPPALKEGEKRPLWMQIGPSFTMIIPMMAGSILMIYSSKMSGRQTGLFMYTGIVTAFGAATVGVFWAINNVRYAKKMLKEEEEHRFDAYGNYLLERAGFVRNAYEKARNALLSMYPPAEYVVNYSSESAELWNRNAGHEDYLSHRVGTGNMDFPAKINVPKERFTMVSDELAEKPLAIKKDFSILYDVPATVDLLKHPLIGIVGGSEKQGAFDLVRVLMAQLAASLCYTDVKFVFICNQDEEAEDWEYAKWFPHVWSEDKKTRYVATNKNEASDILFELMQIFRFRAEEKSNYSSVKKNTIIKPYYIVVVSDLSLLEGELITKYLFETEDNVGVTTLALAESADMLPNECQFILQNDMEFSGTHDLSTNEKKEIRFDYISNDRLLAFARRLLPIEVKEVEIGRDIPEAVSFFEMHEVRTLSEFNVEDKWRKNRNYENMKALIGLKGGGVPCYLDVHEKYHGPHGLVAGTTGSGKSETLQTYLLSLAINFSPDDIGFFIIDYKGGGMAGLFDGLPHMMGSISNLSGNQVRRAMVSIKSENKRRQQLFNDNGVNNINLYTKLYKNGQAAEPIPHLFIIIDEFAELKREEPEFMKELISVAQVGRSLGVHLILATQKPSGTVDDNIWSNAKFRLCLRVQDQQDSKDMLHKPDAAFITQAGRGYLQVGNDEVYELFQSGYSGAPYVENTADIKADMAVLVSTTGNDSYIGTMKTTKDTGKNITQLDAVIRYLAEVASKEGYRKQMQLWMPLLPLTLYLDQLEGYGKQVFDGEKWPELSDKFNLDTLIGLCDDPVNQAQMPLNIDFAGGGHVILAGSVASGKSTFTQSVVYALMKKYSPERLNFYMIDYSAQMLGAFTKSPHCGGVMFEDDTEKISKFFYMMSKIMEERKKMFSGGNYAQYVRKNGYVAPAILIVVDNYPAFREKTNMMYDDRFMRFAKEGVGYGIYLLLTGGGFSASEIPTKLADNVKTIISLNMNDRFAYMDALRTNKVTTLPESNVAGRGLAMVDEVPLEFQTALAFAAEDDFKRNEMIEEECVAMSKAWTGRSAKIIPVIPENPVYAEFEQLEDFKLMNESHRYIPIGYDKVSASVYGIDLAKTYTYLVSGRARTGKTTLLKSLIRTAAAKEGQVVVIEHSTTDLQATAEKAGALYIDTLQKQADFFKDIIGPFKERNALKNKLKSEEKDEFEVFDAMKEHKPYFIICADMVDFINSIYKKEAGVVSIDPFMENIAEKGKGHNIFFFIGINPDFITDVIAKKAYNMFVSYRTGIQLGGNIASIKYFDCNNFSFKEQNVQYKPGLGMIPAANDDTVRNIAIPNIRG